MFERLHFDVLNATCCINMSSMETKMIEDYVSTQVNEMLWKHQMWCILTALFLSSSVTWRKVFVEHNFSYCVQYYMYISLCN